MISTKQRFLRIQSMFHVKATRSLNAIMRARIGSQHACGKDRAQLVFVIEGQVECVVGEAAFALDTDVRKHVFRRAEELKRLIDKMRPKIKKHAAARRRLFLPRIRPDLRPATIKCRFEANNLSE